MQQSMLDSDLRVLRKLFPESVKRETIESQEKSESPSNILFFIPEFGIGSGGHLNIFRFANFLAQQGCNVYLFVLGDINISARKLRGKVNQEYLSPKFSFITKKQLLDMKFRALFFTSWQTVYSSNYYDFSGPLFYFVQDIESKFYPPGSISSAAEHTLRITDRMYFVTAGNWISDYLKKRGINSKRIVSYKFAVDTNSYFPHPNKTKRSSEKTTVVIYSRPGTERRLSAMGWRAVELIAKSFENFEVIIIGAGVVPNDVGFKYKTIGFTSQENLGKIYRSADLAIILSATNASLVSLEALACGIPVLINEGPNNEWIREGLSEIYAVRDNPSDLSRKALSILKDEGAHVRSAAYKDALKLRSQTWERSYQDVWDWLQSKI